MNNIILIISAFFTWLSLMFTTISDNVIVKMSISVIAFSFIVYAFRGGEKDE